MRQFRERPSKLTHCVGTRLVRTNRKAVASPKVGMGPTIIAVVIQCLDRMALNFIEGSHRIRNAQPAFKEPFDLWNGLSRVNLPQAC
jgi:hypothetical protein